MRVLLAVDGSPASRIAGELLAALAWTGDDRIRVVSVQSEALTLAGPHWASLAIEDPVRLDEELRNATQSVLDDATRLLDAAVAATVESHVLRGRPGSAIVEEATVFRADLVVLGSRGHGPFAASLLGSVSAEVVDHAPCPVLVARRHTVGRIVLADDGSPAAAVARAAIGAPPFAALPVLVVSVAVVPPPWQAAVSPLATEAALEVFDDAFEAQRGAHEEIARTAADALRPGRPSVEFEVRAGDAAGEIVAAATESDAGLIAMGTHGRTGLRRLLLGSVARNVLHHAPCSVLIARAIDRDG